MKYSGQSVVKLTQMIQIRGGFCSAGAPKPSLTRTDDNALNLRVISRVLCAAAAAAAAEGSLQDPVDEGRVWNSAFLNLRGDGVGGWIFGWGWGAGLFLSRSPFRNRSQSKKTELMSSSQSKTLVQQTVHLFVMEGDFKYTAPPLLLLLPSSPPLTPPSLQLSTPTPSPPPQTVLRNLACECQETERVVEREGRRGCYLVYA